MLKLYPFKKFTPVTLTLPGSKYIANRAILIAAMAQGRSTITNIPRNNDIDALIETLKKFSIRIQKTDKSSLSIDGQPPPFSLPQKRLNIDTKESGTLSRFITVYSALFKETVMIDGSKRMRQRPMKELFKILKDAHVDVQSESGFLPATIRGPLSAEKISIDSSRSSQYLSALLIAAPYITSSHNLVTIFPEGSVVSGHYIDLTTSLMKDFGVKPQKGEGRYNYKVATNFPYKPVHMTIPADPVSAGYFAALSLLTKNEIILTDYDFHSPQGESGFYKILNFFGLEAFEYRGEGRPGTLKLKPSLKNSPYLKNGDSGYYQFDMSKAPDAVQTLAVTAAFFTGKWEITGIAHLKYKESDRISDTAEELRKFNIDVETYDDRMVVYGRSDIRKEKEKVIIECHNDHRMAMSFSLAGAIRENVFLKGHKCVSKSFPKYFEYYKIAGGRFEEL